ncbi:hypothetical protein D3C72_2501090 [compost metagenome]
MVRYENVDRTVLKTFDHRLNVARCAQRRVQFPIRVVNAWNVFIRQHEVMRANLSSNLHANRLRKTDQSN